MAIYRSKIDWWLLIVVFMPLIYSIVEGISEGDYEAIYAIVPIIIVIILLFSQIKYVVNNGILVINGGLFKQNVNIAAIKSIHKTYNPLSAPALSINRLEIKYGDAFDYLLISPENRQKFIEELTAINPDIDVRV